MTAPDLAALERDLEATAISYETHAAALKGIGGRAYRHTLLRQAALVHAALTHIRAQAAEITALIADNAKLSDAANFEAARSEAQAAALAGAREALTEIAANGPDDARTISGWYALARSQIYRARDWLEQHPAPTQNEGNV